MQAIVFLMIIAMFAGLAAGLQVPLSSLMSQRLGTLESVFIVHFGGAVAAIIPLLAKGGGALPAWRSVPWYALGAGALGLILFGAFSYTIPRLGVATTVTLAVTAQLVLGVILDHFGLFGAPLRPIDPSRIAGLLVLFGGIWLITR
jgi:transporter family-2 protein